MRLTHQVHVPASASNLGAGFDCIGMALDIWLVASLVPGDGPPRHTGAVQGLDPELDVIWSGLRSRKALDGYRLEVHSDIPVSRGLGSSAAATLAALVLGDILDGTERSTEELFAETARREGHPDNAAPCAFGGTVLATNRPGSSTASLVHLSTHENIGVALAVPDRTVETRVARSVLPEQVPSRDVVAQASCAAALVLGLERGDPELIGIGMEDCLAVPRRAGLIPGYEDARDAALAAGAFGMTISGSGSTLIALTTHERAKEVASRMVAAMTASDNPAVALTPQISSRGIIVSHLETG